MDAAMPPKDSDLMTRETCSNDTLNSSWLRFCFRPAAYASQFETGFFASVLREISSWLGKSCFLQNWIEYSFPSRVFNSTTRLKCILQRSLIKPFPQKLKTTPLSATINHPRLSHKNDPVDCLQESYKEKHIE